METFRVKTIVDTNRIRLVAFGLVAISLWILFRLFFLQVVRHDYYALFALNSHEIYQKLHPSRGSIFFQDSRSKQEYPAAINKQFFLVYSVPKEIPTNDVASTTAALVQLLNYDAGEQKNLIEKLASGDSYRVLAKKVDSQAAEKIKALGVRGIYVTPQDYRFYPEENLAANVLGFTVLDDEGRMLGKYGLEGYWEKKLAGKGGFLIGETGAMGSWITLADRTGVQPENGVDLLLTLDRTLQYTACESLHKSMEKYKAKSATLILMQPMTGKILAMCSLPDFDPNMYARVDDISTFNNTAIFTPYEPGSVFKPITMAAALDLGLVNPDTRHTDPCQLEVNGYIIRNALRKCYGNHTMTEALENSVNTTLVWIQEKIGTDRFRDYVQKFGFGSKAGLSLNTEAVGDISSLEKKGKIFGANGAFGQGLSVTPLQLIASYAAIANDGRLPKPYIVEEVRYPNGQKEKTEPEYEQVISPRAAKLLSGMLVSVVENHYRQARIPGYFIGGKTGTAQIAEKGKYSDDRTNHTFVGFAPADDPELVVLVKYEEANEKWAEQTTIPVFKEVMQFALRYYGISTK
ncbi:MAG: hypothetical protein A3I29_01115 [Candidatus Magasanikbacteria bacterium RIFCSPLOWO2_02_FULL_44_11]|uniref:Penicillin-binding protein transpeptidase domain-containing protein n=2 Tax=Candidatus Magasanikiibacteriota TaxID=1752731 RepID=A0A1F6N9U8_9BACT|nr:MAG: hypothetical protein A3D53_00665 [Candidatus Magasanikbacteria bacterium RIFCSPHIGHO2_02_FULL_45_10]OGH80694.1 MAG: hypothetical protein A3I29_01115 [Candidatus Magasanikbacteria bacterium RIFCSPLOWO2_02_FULL_44_11]